ncbi:MAG: SAVED domain-containing protein [Coprobacillus sp.]|nr:SAVED domain-containing protein [Coprobacillus sp.]
MGKKLLIIEHSSIQKMNFSYDKAELEEYAVKKIEINQYNTINNSTLSLEAKVPLLITEIYNVLPQINNYVEKHYQVGYAGIPVGNVPSAFMLGYELDDANKKLYFHKNRSSNIDDNFHLLKDAHSSIKLIVNKQENREYDIGDLMVIIQLTQPIKDNDLDGVLGNNDYILRYEVPEQIDYDIIETAEQANKYAQQIVSEIAKIQKRSNISKIKICIAASSDFIFALGTKFSKTQNIDIIVYQFDKGRYSWGINVSKGTAVINDM